MKNLLLIVVFLFVGFFGFGQEDTVGNPGLPNITPPSPTSYELGKYGQVPINNFTGTFSTEIPLYSYLTRGGIIPISLSYRSNGIRVDQLSTVMGLGWSINMGGVITRIVRDLPDEENVQFFPKEEITQLGGYNSPIAYEYFFDACDMNNDTETDLYSYNFMGYTGSFVFDKNGYIVTLNANNLKIIQLHEDDNFGFKVLAPDGTTYYFLDVEYSRQIIPGGVNTPSRTGWWLSKIVYLNGSEIYFNYITDAYSYIMSVNESLKLRVPHGQAICSGSNPNYPNSYEKIESGMMVSSKKLTQISTNNPLDGKIEIDYSIAHPSVNGYNLLTKIRVKNNKDTIIDSINFDYILTNNKRVFLKSATFLDGEKQYVFDYVDEQLFPVRLSKSQDHWGCYNGRNNSTFLPNTTDLQYAPIEFTAREDGSGANKNPFIEYTKKGMLETIHYPTKGYNKIEYEANTYFGEKITMPELTSLNLNTSTELIWGSDYDVEEIINIENTQVARIQGFAEFNDISSDCENETENEQGIITITDNNTGNFLDFKYITIWGEMSIGTSLPVGGSTSNNGVLYNVFLEEGHSYTIKLHPTRGCTSTNLNLSYYEGVPTIEDSNLATGGVRVKRITSYTSDTEVPNVIRYYYSQKENLLQSSGIEGLKPYYFSPSVLQYECGSSTPSSYSYLHYKILNSSSIRQLYTTSGSTTSYQYITKSFGGDNFENGGEENEYYIGYDYPGNSLYNSNILESTPWVNAGWDNGLLKTKIVFKINEGSIKKIKEKTNYYINDDRSFKKVYGYKVVEKYHNFDTSSAIYKCKAEDLEKSYSYYHCVTHHKHIKFQGICIKADADNRLEYLYHPCFGKEENEIVILPHAIDNLDIMEYTSNSYWSYLSQSIEKMYNLNDDNWLETTTNFFYDNAQHLQLTRTETTDSQQNSIASKTYYPQDRTQLTGLSTTAFIALDSLETQHRIATPIQTETYKNGELLATQRSNYKDWGQNATNTGNIFALETIETSKGDKPLEERIIYHHYDEKGNPIDISKADGTHTYYIWGYNASKPIAKIDNFTRDEAITIQGLINNAVTASNADDDTCLDTESCHEKQLRTALNAIRNNTALANAMITTYTYDPLIGITSVTDPKGDTQYYIYDDFNRLLYVKDSEGHVLSENQYHYRVDD